LPDLKLKAVTVVDGDINVRARRASAVLWWKYRSLP
jgi:hypothetical protein